MIARLLFYTNLFYVSLFQLFIEAMSNIQTHEPMKFKYCSFIVHHFIPIYPKLFLTVLVPRMSKKKFVCLKNHTVWYVVVYSSNLTAQFKKGCHVNHI